MTFLKTAVTAALLCAPLSAEAVTYTFSPDTDSSGTIYGYVMTGASGVQVNGFL